MGMIKQAGKESLNPLNIWKYIKFKYKFHQEHPEYFEADGLLIFVGPQGSGKSLSAVNYVYKLLEMYPKAKLCTNLLLSSHPIITYDEYTDNNKDKIEKFIELGKSIEFINEYMWEAYKVENRVFPFVDDDDFKKYENGEYGFIYLVDEIQLYLNSLESKNINMEVVTEISQQRKQRKHIVATSQVFGRMAKPLREQFSNVVSCHNLLGFLQKNQLIDRDSIETESSADTQISGKVKKTFLWFHNPYTMYSKYDTYYKVKKGKFVSKENQKGDIYENGRIELSNNS